MAASNSASYSLQPFRISPSFSCARVQQKGGRKTGHSVKRPSVRSLWSFRKVGERAWILFHRSKTTVCVNSSLSQFSCTSKVWTGSQIVTAHQKGPHLKKITIETAVLDYIISPHLPWQRKSKVNTCASKDKHWWGKKLYTRLPKSSSSRWNFFLTTTPKQCSSFTVKARLAHFLFHVVLLTLLITAKWVMTSRMLNQIPMPWARSATCRRYSQTNFWASNRISTQLLSNAKSGAKGQAATKMVMKPNCRTEGEGEKAI